MGSDDLDLLNPAQPYSRSGNTHNTSANTQQEIPGPLPQAPSSFIRPRQNGTHDAFSSLAPSFNDAVDATCVKEYSVLPTQASISEGRRLVIAIDYGATFTGT
jgi:hypothetical protein